MSHSSFLALDATRITRIAYREAKMTGIVPEVVIHCGHNVPVRSAIGDSAFDALMSITTAMHR